jgi:Fe-S cluster biogenesis protein NfuA
MRRLLVCAAALLVLGVFGAAPARASHGGVVGLVEVARENKVAGVYEGAVACSGSSCSVTVQIPKKRDYNRFLRWCEGVTPTSVAVTVPANLSFSSAVFCFGPSSWFVRTDAVLTTDTTGTTLATHPSPVAVTVNVTSP